MISREILSCFIFCCKSLGMQCMHIQYNYLMYRCVLYEYLSYISDSISGREEIIKNMYVWPWGKIPVLKYYSICTTGIRINRGWQREGGGQSILRLVEISPQLAIRGQVRVSHPIQITSPSICIHKKLLIKIYVRSYSL